MGWAEGFIAVDWGTTNRRGYLISADGTLQREVEDDQGILSVVPGGFPDAVAELRSRLGNRPMLLAGMVGSNRGWIEVPYVPTPASLADLASALTFVDDADTAIVAGVSHVFGNDADVMRGEEVQIVGAVAASLVPRDCLISHPGTHNKWVVVRGGRIESFRTVMTGELFNLLKAHSILADLLANPVVPVGGFVDGVRHGLARDDLSAELFSVRARVLLGQAERAAAASYASGLLIGNDLKIGLGLGYDSEIVVMGRPELTRLYSAALRLTDHQVCEVDGEQAFLAGARHIVELIA
jgi:2-dehydro-3-deoxygalactonokinase